MKYDAFNPQGPLATIIGASTAPTAVQLFAPTTAQQQAGTPAIGCVEITNSSTVDAFLCIGSTAAAAAAVAALGIPAVGTPVSGMIHLPAGTDKVYSIMSDQFFTAITAGATATLYLLPGRGQ